MIRLKQVTHWAEILVLAGLCSSPEALAHLFPWYWRALQLPSAPWLMALASAGVSQEREPAGEHWLSYMLLWAKGNAWETGCLNKSHSCLGAGRLCVPTAASVGKGPEIEKLSYQFSAECRVHCWTAKAVPKPHMCPMTKSRNQAGQGSLIITLDPELAYLDPGMTFKKPG